MTLWVADLSADRLKGVGPKIAERWARLGVHRMQDVLFHLPSRYQDRMQVVPTIDLEETGINRYHDLDDGNADLFKADNSSRTDSSDAPDIYMGIAGNPDLHF